MTGSQQTKKVLMLPANSLDMRVLHSQVEASTKTSAFEHTLTTFCSHARAEAMYTNAMFFLRLICPLGHNFFLSIRDFSSVRINRQAIIIPQRITAVKPGFFSIVCSWRYTVTPTSAILYVTIDPNG